MPIFGQRVANNWSLTLYYVYDARESTAIEAGKKSTDFCSKNNTTEKMLCAYTRKFQTYRAATLQRQKGLGIHTKVITSSRVPLSEVVSLPFKAKIWLASSTVMNDFSSYMLSNPTIITISISL